jgi:hypothetical protein
MPRPWYRVNEFVVTVPAVLHSGFNYYFSTSAERTAAPRLRMDGETFNSFLITRNAQYIKF